MDIPPPNNPETNFEPQTKQPTETNQPKKPNPSSVYPTPTAPSFFTPSPGLSKGAPEVPNPPPVVTTQYSRVSSTNSNRKLVIFLIALLIFALGVGTGVLLHSALSTDSSTIDNLPESQSEVAADDKAEQKAQEPSDDVDSWARDNHRRADINATHTQLELYYNDNGSYPAESVFSSESSASSTFPGLKVDELRDPYDRFINTTSSDYSYATIGCSSKCASYELKTVLESDEGVYAKSSLN